MPIQRKNWNDAGNMPEDLNLSGAEWFEQLIKDEAAKVLRGSKQSPEPNKMGDKTGDMAMEFSDKSKGKWYDKMISPPPRKAGEPIEDYIKRIRRDRQMGMKEA